MAQAIEVRKLLNYFQISDFEPYLNTFKASQVGVKVHGIRIDG